MARPKKFEIELGTQERNELVAMSRSRTLGAGVVRRAKIVLASAGGESNSSIARRLRTSVSLVGHWRRRYAQFGIAGLYDGVRAGRPRSHDDERIARMINTVLQSQPKGATHWSVRSVAEHTGISKSTVHRVFQLFGLQPHRTKSFRLSTDEQFVEKVRDIVGLYLNPPDKALVLCVDEKSQVQALERTQPVLPMGLGYLEGVPTTISATVPPPCSPPSTWPRDKCSRSARRTIATRSSWPFSSTSKRPCRPISMSI